MQANSQLKKLWTFLIFYTNIYPDSEVAGHFLSAIVPLCFNVMLMSPVTGMDVLEFDRNLKSSNAVFHYLSKEMFPWDEFSIAV